MKELFFLIFPLFLAACVQVGPDYERPSIAIPSKFENAISFGKKDFKEHAQDWWRQYQDPLLNELIDQAFKENLDLKIAVARISQTRASLEGVEANLFPEVELGGSYTRMRNSLNNQSSSTAGPRSYDVYKLGARLSWEIDLFGRLRRAQEMAQATLEAQIEDYEGVLLSLTAEVVQNYIFLRSLQQQVEIFQRLYETSEKLYKLTQDLYESGLGTAIEVHQAKVERNQNQAALASLEASLKTILHHLTVLVGKNPASLYQILRPFKKLPVLPVETFSYLPSDLLQQRPDIRKAERELEAATAEIGVIVGELFPKFSLTGEWGYSSRKGSKLFQSKSLTSTFGPSFSWPIFDFGRVRSQINAQEGFQKESLLQYKDTLLKAFEEVENALVAYKTEAQRYETLEQAAKSSLEAVSLLEALYEAGFENYQAVLKAQITADSNELEKVKSHATLLLNTVTLHKALGGERTFSLKKNP